MLKNFLSWGNNSQNMSDHLLQLPLMLSLSIKHCETSFSSSEVCDPQKHKLQLRESYLILVDVKESKILSFCMCEPSIQVLLKKKGTNVLEGSVAETNNKI